MGTQLLLPAAGALILYLLGRLWLAEHDRELLLKAASRGEAPRGCSELLLLPVVFVVAVVVLSLVRAV